MVLYKKSTIKNEIIYFGVTLFYFNHSTSGGLQGGRGWVKNNDNLVTDTESSPKNAT